MAVREASDEPEFSLATLPPTSGQRRLAIAVFAVLLAAFGIAVPFSATALPRIDAFIPILEFTIFVTDLITAVLLFSIFSIIHSRALLALASSYLFTALIVIPHMLTFPGAFSPTGLLGAGLQSTGWLYFFWHFGFPAAVIAYAWLKDDEHTNRFMQDSTLAAIGWSVAIVISLVCGLTWLATAGDEFLPRLFLDRSHTSPLTPYIIILNLLICALALASLWIRGRSVLDQWLMVVICASITELAATTLFNNTRFNFGWYAGRMFSLVTATVVLIVLLSETTRLYARLARSNIALRRERNNKLMNLEAMAASIAHEVRQPLTIIAMSGNKALQLLGRTSPNLEDARVALNNIVSESHRASEIFDSIRNLFGRIDQGQEPIDVNELVLGTLHALRGELDVHGITARTELTSELPSVMGHRGQLHEVMLNLARNAIEAMGATEEGNRVLRMSTQHNAGNAIAVAVQDTGPGIDPEKLAGIFDAFVTTKPQGMGLGLAICRMIIERHGGQLLAWSNKEKGAIFQFTLPIKSAAGSAATPL